MERPDLQKMLADMERPDLQKVLADMERPDLQKVLADMERPDLQKVLQKFPNLDQNDYDHNHERDVQMIVPVRAKTSPIDHLPLPHVPHVQVHVLVVFIPNLPFPILHILHFRILFTKIWIRN
jgi:hypothetical protein